MEDLSVVYRRAQLKASITGLSFGFFLFFFYLYSLYLILYTDLLFRVLVSSLLRRRSSSTSSRLILSWGTPQSSRNEGCHFCLLFAFCFFSRVVWNIFYSTV